MRRYVGRKLLVASVGVAAVSYAACDPEDTKVAPPDAATPVVREASAPVQRVEAGPAESADAAAAPHDAGPRDGGRDGGKPRRVPDRFGPTGNLMAP